MKKRLTEYQDTEAEIEMGGEGSSGIRLFRQALSSLRNPVYRIYYGGLLGHMASMNMQLVTRSLLIYRLTGSAAILGVMSLASALPMLFLSLFGGVIADRVQKKYVMLAGQMASAVISLCIGLSLTLGYLSSEHSGSWWILIVASVLQGTIMGLMMPSRQAMLPEIVGEEKLMNATALNSFGMNIFRILGPMLAGFLIDAYNFAAVYYVMTGLYLMAVGFISFLPITGTITLRGSGVLADIKEGLQYVRRETTILIVLAFTLIAVVLSMPYMMLLPIFADDILKVGATGMGMLVMVSGIGAIVGSITLATLPNKKRGLILLVGTLLLGLALIAFSASSSWYLSLCFIVFVGLGQTARMTLSNTLLQYYSDDEYRGRVMSIYMMEFGLMSFGTFTAAMLAQTIGAQWALGGFASVLVILTLLTIVFVPRLRKLD